MSLRGVETVGRRRSMFVAVTFDLERSLVRDGLGGARCAELEEVTRGRLFGGESCCRGCREDEH